MRILVGYDDTAQSADALCLAEGLAAMTDGQLVLARVEPLGPYDLIPEKLDDQRRTASEHLNASADELRARGRPVEIADVAFGSPAQALQELAEAGAHDLIVVGSSHRGRAGTVLAGTVGVRLLHGAPCPVAIAPRGLAAAGEWRPKTVGVAFDASPEARAALEEARHLAQAARAKLEVIAVAEVIGSPHETIDPHMYRLASQRQAQGWLREAERVPHEDVKVVARMAVGDPAAELLKISEDLDLLVLGSRGYGPVRRVLLGSVSSHLVEHCRCPLVVTTRASQAGTVSPRSGAVAVEEG